MNCQNQKMEERINKKYPPFNIGILKQGLILSVKRDPNPLKDYLGWMIYREQKSRGFYEDQANVTHVEILGPDQWSVRIQPPLSKLIDVRKVYKGRYVRMMRPNIACYDKFREKISWWAATECNKPYDIFGVLKFKFPKLLQMKHSPFCSESMLWSIRKEFPEFMGLLENYQCMPAHSQTKNFICEWEGYIT